MSFKSTPHARGSTLQNAPRWESPPVYPACAGIHPWNPELGTRNLGLPRMRGDPPSSVSGLIVYLTSTPHARGSTPEAPNRRPQAVYPACAGIHLPQP